MRDGNHVWKTTPVNAVVLNVTLMQYVSQKSRPDEPPNAGPSEREIGPGSSPYIRDFKKHIRK